MALFSQANVMWRNVQTNHMRVACKAVCGFVQIATLIFFLFPIGINALSVNSLSLINNTDGGAGDHLFGEPDFSGLGNNFYDDSTGSVPNGINQWRSQVNIDSQSTTTFSIRYASGVFSEGQWSINSALYASHAFDINVDISAESGESWSLAVAIRRVGAVTISGSGDEGELELKALDVSWSGNLTGTANSLDLPGLGNIVGSGSISDTVFDQDTTAILTGTGPQSVTLTFSSDTDTISDGGVFKNGKEVALRMGMAATLPNFTMGEYPGQGSRDSASDGIFVEAQLYSTADSCAIFPDGAQNSSDSGGIAFSWGSKIINSPDDILDSKNLTDNAGANTSCDGASCSASNVAVASPTLPVFAGGANISVPGQDSLSLAPGDYGSLIMNSESQLELQAGDYTFSSQFLTSWMSAITVSGTGTARVFVDGNIQFASFVSINKEASASQLFFAASGSIEIIGGADIHALLYSGGDINLAGGAYITGAATSDSTINLTSASSIIFDQAAVATADFGTACGIIPIPAVLVGEYRMETTGWDGSNGEVIDESANVLHAIATGASSGNSSPAPAISGTPGSCNYGEFDGVDDVITIADNALLYFSDSMSISVWIRARSAGDTNQGIILSKAYSIIFASYSLHMLGEDTVQFSWCTASTSGFCTTYESIDSGPIISLNSWVHVAVSFQSGMQKLYINGVEVDSGTSSSSIVSDDDDVFIGAVNNESFGIRREFDGQIDEVQIYSGALTAAEVDTLYQATHGCPPAVVFDHYEIDVGAGSASVCAPFSISITACSDDANPCTTMSDYDASIELSSSSNRGNWAVINSGSLSPGIDNDNNGAASYTFAAISDGIAQLSLSNGHADDLTITVTDNAVPSSTVSSVISFSDNALFITENDSFADDFIAGRDHQLKAEVQSHDPDTGLCQVLSSYNGNVNLQAFISRSINDPAGAAPAINSIAMPNSAPENSNIVLNFVNGISSFTLTSSDVGQYSLNLTDKDSGLIVNEVGDAITLSGSSSQFTVRPFGFAVTVSSTPANPAANTADGTIFIAAGNDFNLDVAAVLYSSADDSDADGQPDGHADNDASNNTDLSNNAIAASFSTPESMALTATLISPATGNNPGLSGLTSLSANGTVTVQFHEVGIIEVKAAGDGSYLGRGVNLIGASGYIGRFIPDHFSIAADNGSFANSCGIFSYSGQDFTYALNPALTITAQSSNGNTTQNYTDASGNWQKLAATDIDNQRLFPLMDNSIAMNNSINGGVLSQGVAGVMLYQFSAADSYRYDNADANAQSPAFNTGYSITVNSFSDSDGVGFIGPLQLDPAAIEIRLGRLKLENGFGPETMALDIAGQLEYIDGSGSFVINTDDSCTVLTARISTTPSEPNPLAVGSGSSNFTFTNANLITALAAFNLTAPGAGNTGAVIISVDLSNMDWLMFDWQGSGLIGHPDVTATFGVYRGRDRVIFWREVRD